MRWVVCGSEPASFEAVIVAGIGQHCFRCYNQDVARRMGVDFDNSSLAPVTLNDVEGVPHHFEIRSRLVAAPRSWARSAPSAHPRVDTYRSPYK